MAHLRGLIVAQSQYGTMNNDKEPAERILCNVLSNLCFATLLRYSKKWPLYLPDWL